MARVARIFLMHQTKTGKNIPNGLKIDQMTVKFTNIFHFKTLQNLPKFGLFGLKIYHLATLAMA
jgi:hypothetical protein